MTGEEVLNLTMQEDNDAEAKTIRDYFLKMMLLLWEEGEGFDSKRPFGNSGWDYDLYRCLAEHEIIKAKWHEEEDGYRYIDEITSKEMDKGNKLIIKAIKAL